MQELFGSMLGQTDLSETLTAIVKIDPAFDKDKFLLEMEYDIIPNILEAMVRPEEKVNKLEFYFMKIFQFFDDSTRGKGK